MDGHCTIRNRENRWGKGGILSTGTENWVVTGKDIHSGWRHKGGRARAQMWMWVVSDVEKENMYLMQP